MKKSIITLSIILGLSMTSFADGGLFQRGNNGQNGQKSGFIFFDNNTRGEDVMPLLPPHDSGEDEPAVPVGSGIALLTALGAGYVVAKRRKE
jgi:hypothetical protein